MTDSKNAGKPIAVIPIVPGDFGRSEEEKERGRRLAETLGGEDPFAEDEEIILRRLTEMDSELLVKALREYEFDPFPDDLPEEVRKAVVGNLFEPHRFFCGIRLKSEEPNPYAGYVGISDLRDAVPEIEIVLLDGFRRRGIGTRAVRLLTEKTEEKAGIRIFRARVETENSACHAFMDSLGAEPKRAAPPFEGISEELLRDMEDGGPVSENAERLAAKFGVRPERLTVCVPEYEIDVRNFHMRKNGNAPRSLGETPSTRYNEDMKNPTRTSGSA